jgi:hypothetical protein
MCLGVALIAAGCASSDVTSRRRYIGDERLPRPGRVIVYDIAASPNEIPTNAAITGHYERRATPQTSKEIQLGHQLGARVAQELVSEILAMGLPAERAGGPPPHVNDLVIRGAFVKIDEGNRLKRMIIGFGAGAGELKTHVEGYQITARGPRLLGEGEFEAGGGKMPGMLVPVAGGAATGGAAMSAAISGGMNVAQEAGPESMKAAAKRTAKEIAKVLSRAFVKQGWIPPDKAM